MSAATRIAVLAAALTAVGVAATTDVRRLGWAVADPQFAAIALASIPALVLGFFVASDRRALTPNSATGLWTLWLAIALLAGLFGAAPASATLSAGVFAATAAGAISLVRSGGWTPLLVVLAAIAVCHGTLGVVATILGLTDPLSDEGRLRLLTFEPNHLARIAGLGAVASAAIGLRAARSVPHLLALPISVACASAVFLTQSRTGAAAMVLALAVGLFRAIRPRLAMVGAAAALLVVGAIGLAGLAGPAVDQVTRSDDRTFENIRGGNGRVELWTALAPDVWSSPVIGHGVGADFAEVSQLRRDGKIGFHAEHTHSLPLHLALTTGLLGLVVAGGATTLLVRSGWRRSDPWPLALVALILVDGATEAILSTPGPAWILLTGAAVSLTAPSGRASMRTTDSQQIRRDVTSLELSPSQ